MLAARLAVGLLFFLSGESKLTVSSRRKQMNETLVKANVPFPAFNTWFVSAVECVFGLLLFLGALTPLACVMLAFVMIVALATSKLKEIQAPSAADWVSQFLYFPETLYLVILAWLFVSGPGRFSLDYLIFF